MIKVDPTLNYSLSNILSINETNQNPNETATGRSLTPLRLFLGIVYTSVIIFTIFGNSLVICAVLRYRRLRRKTNFIILSLAATDITVAILVMPFALIYDLKGEWYFGWEICYFFRSCDIMCCTASILHICCIALDRFWAIKSPFKYKEKMTKRTLGAMIASTWVVSAAISFVPIFAGWFIDDPAHLYIDSGSCDLTVNKIYAILATGAAFYVPFLLMSIAYAYILRIARAQAERMKKRKISLLTSSEIADKSRTMKMMAREQKAVITLGTVMGVFIVCWLPFFLMFIIMTFCSNCFLSFTAVSLITWLGYLNSVLNPFIYAFLNRDFRRAFQNILSCGHYGGHPDSAISTTMGQNISRWEDSPQPTTINRRPTISSSSSDAEKQLTIPEKCAVGWAEDL